MVGLAFAAVIYAYGGVDATAGYLSAYLLECALSVDNVLVLVIFRKQRVASHALPRFLRWSVAAAIISRALFLVGSVYLARTCDGLLYLLGVYFIYAAIGCLEDDDDDDGDPIPLFRGDLLALIVLQVGFAGDAVAMLSVSQDIFILVTSSAMAMLFLGSLYFVLERAYKNDRLRQPRTALVVLLSLVGVKLFTHEMIDVPPIVMLVVLAAVIAVGIRSSIRPARSAADPRPT